MIDCLKINGIKVPVCEINLFDNWTEGWHRFGDVARYVASDPTAAREYYYRAQDGTRMTYEDIVQSFHQPAETKRIQYVRCCNGSRMHVVGELTDNQLTLEATEDDSPQYYPLPLSNVGDAEMAEIQRLFATGTSGWSTTIRVAENPGQLAPPLVAYHREFEPATVITTGNFDDRPGILAGFRRLVNSLKQSFSSLNRWVKDSAAGAGSIASSSS